MADKDDKNLPELNVDLDTLCFIIVKAREFDAKVEPEEPDPGSNPADDGEREILEDREDDNTLAELREAIADLNEDEVIDVIALAWLGRGDFEIAEWDEARALADERHRRNSASYLIGMPALGDYLEEGLAAFGLSCEDSEKGRL
jgi:Protein of unknown function (DUF3775)